MIDKFDEEMIEIYKEDINDNDASYVPFGFAFQADAGIILFIKHFSEVKSISVESHLQDIELVKKNGELILAQAKSSQNPMNANNEKEKLTDALFSLIKCNNNESDMLIYISNLPDPLKSNDKNEFNLKEVNYKYLSPEATSNVDKAIEKLKEKLTSTINDPNTRKKIKEKSLIVLKHLVDLNKEKLYFISIPKYYGDKEEDRVCEIINQIQFFLSNEMKYTAYMALSMSKQIYEIWHNKCFFDSTVSAKSDKKIIKKDELIWPLITLFSERMNVLDLQEIIDEELTNEMQEKISYLSRDFIKLNDFELVNKILSLYNEYKKLNTTKKNKLNFIKDNWTYFVNDFKYLNEDTDFDDVDKKCVIMFFIYSILENYLNVQKVLKWGEINENN